MINDHRSPGEVIGFGLGDQFRFIKLTNLAGKNDLPFTGLVSILFALQDLFLDAFQISAVHLGQNVDGNGRGFPVGFLQYDFVANEFFKLGRNVVLASLVGPFSDGRWLAPKTGGRKN